MAASQEVDLNYTLGVASLENNRCGEAIEYFLKVVEVEAQHSKGRYYLGYCYTNTKRYDKARQIFKGLIDDEPKNALALLQAGINELESKKSAKALELLQRALPLNPNSGSAHYYLGLALQAQGQLGPSMEVLKKAAQLTKELEIPSLYFQAVALIKLKDSSGALVLLERVKFQAPDSGYAESAQQLIDRIDGKNSASASGFKFVGVLGVQYDTNVILEPDTIEVSDEDDFRGVANLVLKYNHGALGLLYNFYHSQHVELTDFNVQSHQAHIDLSFPTTFRGKSTLFGVKGGTSFSLLTNSLAFFSRNHSLETYMSREWSPSYSLNLSFMSELEAFREADEDRDNVAFALKVGHLVALYKNVIFAGFETGLRFEDADRDFDLFGFNGGAQLSAAFWSLNWASNFTYEKEKYFRNALNREDNILGAGVSVSKKWAPITLKLGYQFSNDNSNVAQFEYVRSIISFNFMGEF